MIQDQNGHSNGVATEDLIRVATEDAAAEMRKAFAPALDLTSQGAEVVRLKFAIADGQVRKLQVKAAVNRTEKERYEHLAQVLGIPLSILIRRELDRLCVEAGVR